MSDFRSTMVRLNPGFISQKYQSYHEWMKRIHNPTSSRHQKSTSCSIQKYEQGLENLILLAWCQETGTAKASRKSIHVSCPFCPLCPLCPLASVKVKDESRTNRGRTAITQTLTSKPRIHKKHPGLPLCMTSPQHRVTISTARVVGTLRLADWCVRSRKKKDPRPIERLSIGSGSAGWYQICARRMVEEKGEWDFSNMRLNLVFFWILFMLIGVFFLLTSLRYTLYPTYASF